MRFCRTWQRRRQGAIVSESAISPEPAVKVLFLGSPSADYLSDGLFHGLRSLLGSGVVDAPRIDRMYTSFGEQQHLYGAGFTLYTLLEDIPLRRDEPLQRAVQGEFDVVVTADAYRYIDFLEELTAAVPEVVVAALDGTDSPVPFPYTVALWRARDRRRIAKLSGRVHLFKRELDCRALVSLYLRFPFGVSPRRTGLAAPRRIRGRLPFSQRLRTISFSIPQSKIVTQLPAKSKLFPLHIVDEEVAAHVPGARVRPIFARESDYYSDLRASHYAVTMKRAGWDCLRHYEIAANATVMCFRDLRRKPVLSAPHGLIPGHNCLSYESFADLRRVRGRLDQARYAELQRHSLAWARANSTRVRAEVFLNRLGF